MVHKKLSVDPLRFVRNILDIDSGLIHYYKDCPDIGNHICYKTFFEYFNEDRAICQLCSSKRSVDNDSMYAEMISRSIGIVILSSLKDNLSKGKYL